MVAIDNAPISKAVTAIRRYVHRDNKMHFQANAPSFLRNAQALRVAGINR